MNSTPWMPDSIIRLTALPPPPPRPTTLILAPTWSSTRWNFSRDSSLMMSSLSFLEPVLEPGERALLAVLGQTAVLPNAEAVEDEPNGGGEVGGRDAVDEAADPARVAAPHRQVEDLLGHLLEAFEEGRAAGEDDARVQRLVVAHALDVVVDDAKDLLGPGLDDVGQQLARQDPGLAALADRGDLDRLLVLDGRAGDAAELLLDPLGLGDGRPQADGDVVGEVVAPDGDGRGVPEAAALVDRHLGCAGADVDLADAELALVLGQDGLGRGDLVEDDLLDADAGPLDAALEVLERGQGGGDDVDVDLELDAAHADRVLDAVLVVDDELLGDDVDDVPVRRDGDGLGLVDDAADVLAGDLPVLARDGDDAAAVEALDVGPGDAEEGRADLDPGHELRLFLGLLDGRGRRLEVDDDALAQAVGVGRADADDLDLALLGHLGDDGHDLARPDVEGDDVAVLGHGSVSFVRCREFVRGGGRRGREIGASVEAHVDQGQGAELGLPFGPPGPEGGEGRRGRVGGDDQPDGIVLERELERAVVVRPDAEKAGPFGRRQPVQGAPGRVPFLEEARGETGLVADDGQGVLVERKDLLEDAPVLVGELQAAPVEQGVGRPLDDHDPQAGGKVLLDARVLDPGQAADLGPHGLEGAEEDVAEPRRRVEALDRLAQAGLGADDLDLADGQLVPRDEKEIGLSDGREQGRLEREEKDDVAGPQDASAPALLDGQGPFPRPGEEAAGEERRLPLAPEIADDGRHVSPWPPASR